MELQLRVGGKYRTRDGKEVVTIVSALGQRDWPFVGHNTLTYTPTGIYESDFRESENDLVEEVIPEPEEPVIDSQEPTPIACYVILRDTPDIVALPSNTYSSILKCGTLEVLTADEEENQVALFAPNSWVAYVNKEPVND